ncbi:UDP-N-acetylglucosamine 1-carboxyvinyltransferase [Candidatus Roizmanbacteria bacterium]|nr:UDP-N-acetylglucosamine 1-carboxyvinyltransferase [Candidatus Roizmanbacteria bacterium]
MEDVFIIRGGKPLKGEVLLSGAKNVALKTIIAALLFDSKVVLKNIPRISDVFELVHLIKKLGVWAEFIDQNTLEIDNSALQNNKVDLLHASKIRASFLLFAPLLHRVGECFIPNPGGCRIGERPINRIIDGMKELGISVEYDSNTGYYFAKMKDGPKRGYSFPKSTHTGTELLILLSVFGRGKILLENAAQEPEIDELIEFLNQAGARIERHGRKIAISGVKKLVQVKPYKIHSDRNEAITFAALGVASKGDVVIKPIAPELINAFITKTKETGSGVEIISRGAVRFFYKSKIKPVDVETSIHPGFMTDWQPNWAVLMTQSTGDALIHEKVFENRFSYVKELRKLGAKIKFVNREVENPSEFYFFNHSERKRYQQAIKIHGGYPLHGGALRIADLRAGASLVLAALIAKGVSVVIGASILERGYEEVVNKILRLGGDIKKI